MAPESTSSVVWDDVAEAAGIAFHTWLYQPELTWAKKAWEMIEVSVINFREVVSDPQ